MTEITDSPVEFGLIPHDHWYQPDWIDEDRARKYREELVAGNIIYGDSVPSVASCLLLRHYTDLFPLDIAICAALIQGYVPISFLETITLRHKQVFFPSRAHAKIQVLLACRVRLHNLSRNLSIFNLLTDHT